MSTEALLNEGHILRVDQQAAVAYTANDLICTTTLSGVAAPITPKSGTSRFRISLALDTDAQLQKIVDGAVTTYLASKDTIEADTENEYEFDVTGGHTYDFSFTASGTLLKFVLKEV